MYIYFTLKASDIVHIDDFKGNKVGGTRGKSVLFLPQMTTCEECSLHDIAESPIPKDCVDESTTDAHVHYAKVNVNVCNVVIYRATCIPCKSAV